MNDMHIDPAALEAEAAALAQEFPAEPAQPLAPAAPIHDEQTIAGYQVIAMGLVAQGSAVLVPAWKVSQGECKELGDAIVTALLLWFPDGIIPPKYLALLSILAVGWKIAEARRDPQTGQLIPARHVKQAKPEPDKPA